MKKQIRVIAEVLILFRPEMKELFTQSFPKFLKQAGIFIK
jgi:hypothetical protein